MHLAATKGHIVVAARSGLADVGNMLLDKSADLSIATRDGWTPLDLAASSGHAQVVKLLLNKGASLSVATKDGITPLYAAADSGHVEVVKMLLNEGADVSIAAKNGATPLNAAASNGHAEVVKILLNNSPDLPIANTNEIVCAEPQTLKPEHPYGLASQYTLGESYLSTRDTSENPVVERLAFRFPAASGAILEQLVYRQGDDSQLQAEHQDPMFESMTSMDSRHVRHTLRLECPIGAYLEEHHSATSDIGTIVVLSGEGMHAVCSTIREQLDCAWPNLSMTVLQQLNQARQHTGISAREDGSNLDDMKMHIDMGLDETYVRLEASRSTIDELTDVFSWLSSVLRNATNPGLFVSEAKCSIDKSRTTTIGLLPLRPVALSADLPCWHILFPKKVIGHWSSNNTSKLTSRDPNMRGLEISPRLMFQLAGIELPVFNEQSGLVLAGFHTILKPVYTNITRDQLQWHLYSGSITDDGPPFELLEQGNPDTLGQHNFFAKRISDLLAPSRHFLGWCRKAVVMLGTDQDYGRLQWTRANEKLHEWSISTRSLGLSLGYSGPSFGVGQGYQMTRDEHNPFQDREKNFQNQITMAKDIQILLYCSSRKQAWLVPKTSVLLQLVILWIREMRRRDPAVNIPQPFASPSYDGAESAFKMLKECQEYDTFLGLENDKYLLRHRITELLFALAILARPKSRDGSFIRGFDLADLIAPDRYLRLKFERLSLNIGGGKIDTMFQFPHLNLLTSDNEGWIRMLDDVKNILFFEGLPDPIIPEMRILPELCPMWHTLPAGRNYLAATMKSLADLRYRYGEDSSISSQVTKDAHWHSPSAQPFASCRKCYRQCDRSQFIRVHGRVQPPKDQELLSYSHGAIIFRQEEDFLGLYSA